MKKVDVEKLVSKSIITTVVLIVVMIFMSLENKGYQDFAFCLKMYPLMLVVSILFLLIAGIFVALGFVKNQKFFEVSAWFAGLATLSMILKINDEANGIALDFYLPKVLGKMHITLHPLLNLIFLLCIVFVWIRTIYCINKK